MRAVRLARGDATSGRLHLGMHPKGCQSRIVHGANDPWGLDAVCDSIQNETIVAAKA